MRLRCVYSAIRNFDEAHAVRRLDHFVVALGDRVAMTRIVAHACKTSPVWTRSDPSALWTKYNPRGSEAQATLLYRQLEEHTENALKTCGYKYRFRGNRSLHSHHGFRATECGFCCSSHLLKDSGHKMTWICFNTWRGRRGGGDGGSGHG